MDDGPKNPRPDRDRRVRQADRMARVLGVLWRIQGRGSWNASKLAAELDCTVRTVHRDLAVLSYAGVPWYFDRDADGYRVRDGVTFPTLPLTDAEAFSQVEAEEVAANVAGFGDRLSPKLTNDRNAAEKLEDARSVVSVSGLKFGTAEGIGPKAEAVRFAVLNGLRVRGEYKVEGGVKTLDLHPYRLCLLGRAWYVVGRNDGEDAPKTYKLGRFETLEPTDEPGDDAADFDLDGYLGDAWAVFRGGESYDVEVWCPAEGAGRMTETRWHRSQRVERHPDGSVTLRFRVCGLTEVAEWVLSQTPKVRAVAPDALKERVIALLERSLDLHAGPAGPR